MTKYVVLIIFIIHSIISIEKVESQIQLNPNKIVTLIENDTIIFKGIFKVSVSPSGKKIAIIDGALLFIALYDVESGKMEKYYYTNDSLSDYFIDYDRYFKRDDAPNFFLISRKFGDSINLLSKNLINTFHTLNYFSDNMILVGSYLRAYAIDTSNPKKILRGKDKQLVNISSFIAMDSNLKIIKVQPYQTWTSEWPSARCLYPFSDTSLIIPVSNFSNNNYDSAVAFSLYKTNGLKLKLISYLPDDYKKKYIGYSVFQNQIICKLKSKYFWTVNADYKIRSVFDTCSFPIIGFDTTNLQYWNELIPLAKEEKKKADSIRKKLHLYLPIANLDSWKDSLLCINVIKNKKYYIQFYSEFGELRKTFILNPPLNQKIVHISFVSNINKIIAITNDDKNYYITDYYVPKEI